MLSEAKADVDESGGGEVDPGQVQHSACKSRCHHDPGPFTGVPVQLGTKEDLSGYLLLLDLTFGNQYAAV